jgi:hypothetical protein
MAFLAGNPPIYTGSGLPITSDAYLYRDWGVQIVSLGRVPYLQIPIEYPPGLLPFILLPTWLLDAMHLPFLPSFVFLMVVVDGLGLMGLWRLGKTWGSMLGPWLWVVGLPLLGPIALLRLDLVPAVATIWCLERAAANKWTSSGALLGFGILAKVYPVFLLPSMIVITPLRRKVTLGVIAIVVLGLIPFGGFIGGITRSVASYHFHRGIEIESLWANALLIISKVGYRVAPLKASGSWEITADIAPTLETLSSALSLGAVAFFTWWSGRSSYRDARYVAATWLPTLAVLLIVGRVLSPQYLVWLVALGAASACASETFSRRTGLLLLASCLLTQMEYPFNFFGVVMADPASLAVLTARNLCLILLASSTIRTWLRVGN